MEEWLRRDEDVQRTRTRFRGVLMKMVPSLGSRSVPKAFADADWQAMKLVAERAKFRVDEIQARVACP